MNIFLWTLQVLLALHTIMGAIWKFLNPEQAVTSLQAIPHSAWIGLSVFEIVCSVGLFLPAIYKPWAKLAPVAALGIAAEMALFSIVHFQSGEASNSPVIYWGVVAVVCLFVAYGRFVLKPNYTK